MGRDLRGKNLGKGISQRKDGWYVARFTSKNGIRKNKVYGTVAECREWLARAKKYDNPNGAMNPTETTLDELYDVWMSAKEVQTRENTHEGYKSAYKTHISPVIGSMYLADIKPANCQVVFDRMATEKVNGRPYKSSTMGHVRICLHNLLEYAVTNEVLDRNPCGKKVKSDLGTSSTERQVLTVEEEAIFINAAQDSKYGLQYLFLLETGLRIGELIGLQWGDVDVETGFMSIKRTVSGRDDKWQGNETKTASGMRTVFLSDRAKSILAEQKGKNDSLENIPDEFSEFVFLGKSGKPLSYHAYVNGLNALCKKTHLPHISPHVLRHTFATRAIESKMSPKVLQKLLGHANINITMNLYVHVTEKEKEAEMRNMEQHRREQMSEVGTKIGTRGCTDPTGTL